MLSKEKKSLFKKLNKIHGIWIDDYNDEITVQALDKDAQAVQDILDSFDIKYEQSSFYQNDMSGVNFTFNILEK